MQSIYHQADCVLVWLGLEDVSNSKIMHLLKRIDKSHHPARVRDGREWLPDGKCLDRYRSDLVAFLRNAYFRRVWVIQEIALGSEVFVVCGSQGVRWSALDALVGCIWKETPIRGRAIDHLAQLCQSRSRRLEAQPVSLLQVLSESREAEATEPRDKLYGILSLAFDSSLYVIQLDYSRTDSCVCLEVTRAVIWAKRSLDIIFVSSRREKSSLRLPSWCPDYLHWPGDPACNQLVPYVSGLDSRASGAPGPAKWRASGGSLVNRDVVRIQHRLLLTRGIKIGTINGLGCLPRERCKPCHTGDSFRPCSRSDRALFSAITRTLGLHGWSSPQANANTDNGDGISRLFYYLYTFDTSRKAGSKNSRYFKERYSTIIDWREANRNFRVFGKTLGERSNNMDASLYTGAFRDSVHALIRAAMRSGDNAWINPWNYGHTGHRLPAELGVALDGLQSLIRAELRLMTTSKDDVGWAHPDARLDDGIWLLHGCSLPAVLRPSGSHEDEHILVGYAYVEGVMNGEEWMRRETRDLRQVVLC
ncbi:hypothetical protein PV08_02061 [Exophiala spinifera]|uniref:Heterokaryon incompatibility domain-containing protein n=1 Tax=Exophiala spinifera TaxID=91928 RepID=A0A0D1Z1G8_9EURO|nr:uncharacterized protein PV08_02061 [Exophiala spinifera]KIW21481.1 hypothetical protein PV08_02061 [Exophiala spinifera]